MSGKNSKMRSTIMANGLTEIPAVVRRAFRLSPGDALEWLIEGDSIRVVPLRVDPMAAFRRQGQGGSVTRLLADRRAESA
jgi:bifunctional DNA-binding transcriptional regulator/antitoxin component of YhaV-PrlF toxin-antitoxin module